MKKSKHFRKDVIIARIIAALILIVLIALIVTVVSHFTKSSGNKDSQNTQNTQDVNIGNTNSEDNDTQNQDSESQDDTSNDDAPNNDMPNDDGSNAPQGSEDDSDTDVVEKVYVKTTARVRLREEPNTNCRTLEGINSGVELEVLETLEGWYKVSYNGKTGYVSADYAKIVEE